MKKFYIILMAITFALQLTACSAHTVETREISAVVINCEKGTFVPHEEYLAEANICLAFKKMEAYAYFKALADEHGSWQYYVTVSYDGEEYTVSRMEEYEIGATITITGTFTYSGEELLYVDCK